MPLRDAPNPSPLDPQTLRWRCDPAQIGAASTEEIPPVEGIVGQEDALQALRFGLEIDARGQNIFVRGLAGSGRLSLIREVLREVDPNRPLAPDRVYVHNFRRADSPRLLTLPRGQGAIFRRSLEDLGRFIREELPPSLHSDELHGHRTALERQWQADLETLTQPFEKELEDAGLTLAVASTGDMHRPVILPVFEGDPVPPEQLQVLTASGQISEEEAEQIVARIQSFRPKLEQTHIKAAELRRQNRGRLRDLLEEEARRILRHAVRHLVEAFPEATGWLDELIEDTATRRLPDIEQESFDFLALYEVNLLLSHSDEERPALIENAPTMQSLLGTMEVMVGADGMPRASHMNLHGGSLLRADGGFLVMEARDVLTEPGAWTALIRTLRSGYIELAPPEGPTTIRVPILKPQPIPIRVKVVLLGDGPVYHLLDQLDPDFPLLFKVLADFDTTASREDGLRFYPGVLSRLVQRENLLHLDASAIAGLIEHGARIASVAEKVTTRFGQVADIAREGSYLARSQGEKQITASHIQEAVGRAKRRADLPGRRFRQQIAAGILGIRTQGEAIGQVNGLAVMQTGPLVHGFPSRITATIGAGTGGAVDVEREAELSGAIHTKAFFILRGLLRSLLRTDHPLTFDASIAFEQSYGRIDGDSASGVELCCLLSALTQIPVRQDLAMTGAVDQMGNVLPVGAVNEKIEGFYDACVTLGLSGTQGVILPRANVGDLMLRPDVVEACAQGRFAVYGVASIGEALGLLTGRDPGKQDAQGRWEEGSVLALAVAKARHYWEMVQSSPALQRGGASSS